MRRVVWVVLGIVGVAALVYAASSVLMPHRSESEAAVPTIQPGAAPTAQLVFVLVAARDIRRGARIQAADLTIMGWPITDEVMPPTGALLAEAPGSEEAFEQVIGRIARTDIIKNQPLLDFMLTPREIPESLKD